MLEGYQLTPQPLTPSIPSTTSSQVHAPRLAHSPQDFSEDQKMLLSTLPVIRLSDLGPVLILPTGSIPNSSLNILSRFHVFPMSFLKTE